MEAFIDTSALLGVAFDAERAIDLAHRLEGFTTVAASSQLEAEFRSACHREHRPVDDALLKNLEWVTPVRPLHAEIIRVLDAGYLRGADCWHLATALDLAPEPAQLSFLTLDLRQREIAAKLGFAM